MAKRQKRTTETAPLKWQEVSYILNNDGTAYGRSRNAKLKRIRYKPMIQYIGGWKFIPEGMNPWLQKEETDLEDPNL